MENAPQTEPAKKEESKLKARNIITMTARLAQILAEEVDHLTAMQVSNIKTLQQEKLFLINALDAQRRLIDKHPHLMETIPSQDRDDLKAVVKVFNDILAENHHKLTVAREVNHRIVQAITEVVTKNTRRMAYNGKGATGPAPFETLSVTLNERI